MKSLIRLIASAAFSLMLVAAVSMSITGCSADTLSGPDFSAYGEETSGGTSSGGSEHNYGDKSGQETSGGTSSGGSEHNYGD